MQQDVPTDSSPGLDNSVFLQVIEKGDLSDRMRLAEQLAGFLANESEPREERALVVPAAMQLMADPEFEVRATLAQGLIDTPDLDADLLFAIIADEDDIALPFLAATPALDTVRMLAVLAAGDMARQAIIALRPDLPAPVIDAILRPVGNPAPPRPESPDCSTAAISSRIASSPIAFSVPFIACRAEPLMIGISSPG